MTFLEYDDAGDVYDNPSDSWDGGSPSPTMPIGGLLIAMTDPLSQFPEWVEIEQWAMTVDTTYGRQHELQQIEAQTLVAVMDNRTGLFSSWNFASPFTNLLQLDDSIIPSTGDIASSTHWTYGSFTSETSLSATGGGQDPTLPALQIASGTEGSATATLSSDGYVAVTAGKYYTGFAAFRAIATSRTCSVGIIWYASDLSVVSTSTGSTVVDLTTGYTKATVTDVAPSGAVWAGPLLTVEGTSSGELHVGSRFGITQRYVDISTGYVLDVAAFGPGGYGLTIGKPMQLNGSTDGETFYPCAFGYLETSIPTIIDELNKTVSLNAADAFKFFTNSVITSSLYPGLVVADGALLYWRLGDPIGTTLCGDFSQTGNLGTVSNAVFGQPGLIDSDTDGAALFPASGSPHVTVSPIPVDPPSNYVTMEVWISIETAPGSDAAFCGVGPSTALQMGITTVGAPYWSAGSGYTTAIPITGGGPHHLVLTYDNATGVLRGYQDGTLQITESVGTGILDGTEEAVINNLGDLPNFTADEFAIYPTMLSGEQVADHFDLGLAGFTIPGGSTDSGTLILLFLLASGFPLWMMDIPVTTTAIQSPTVTLGSTSVISTVNQIVASEQGLLYQNRSGIFVLLPRSYFIQAEAATTVQATFENSPSSELYYLPANFQPALDDEDLWNDVPTQTSVGNPASPTTGPLHDVQDIVSIAHFGKRSLQGYTSMLYANDEDTISLGEFLLLTYSVPFTRIRSAQISSAANQGSALLQMFQRDLIDLLAFIYHPQDAGEDFNEEAQIEKIQHHVQPGLWLTTYQLTPYLYSTTTWFTWDDATLGRWDESNLWAF